MDDGGERERDIEKEEEEYDGGKAGQGHLEAALHRGPPHCYTRQSALAGRLDLLNRGPRAAWALIHHPFIIQG